MQVIEAISMAGSRSRKAPQPDQNLAESGSSRQFLPIGLDVGNGATKLYSGLGSPALESYILYREEPPAHPGQGYVEYCEGDRADLTGRYWVGGINAYYSHPAAIMRVSESKDGKVELCLQLLLSALTSLPHREEWNLGVVASVHDGPTFGPAIAQALSGSHRVKLAGRPSLVNVRVLKVLEEGAGAIFSIRGDFDITNALLLDMGAGTCIVSAFNGLQMTDRDYSPEAGTENLIDAIARHQSVRSHLKRPADRHLIRAGIETGDFSYGTQEPNWNFQPAYKACLPEWFNLGLKPFVKQAEIRMPGATAIVAVGGGACLPGMGQILAGRNIKIPLQPRWQNAKGLHEIAQRLLAQP